MHMKKRFLKIRFAPIVLVLGVAICLVSVDAIGSSVEDVLAESNSRVPGSKPSEVDEIIQEADKIKNPAQPFNISLKTSGNKSSYKLGESVQFSVEVDRACYLTLLNIKKDGKTLGVLFPNVWHTSQEVKKGKTYTIPAPDAKFHFRIAGPSGMEYVKAIATMKPVLDNMEKAAKKAAEKGDFASLANPKSILVELKNSLSTQSDKDWAEKTLSFAVIDPNFEIHELKTDPMSVQPGADFKLIASYTLLDPETQAEKIPANYLYAIEKDGKQLTKNGPFPIQVDNGGRISLRKDLTASKRKGRYTIRFTMKYKEKSAEKTAYFEIR
jgi:Domain of unknown function (DUF4384)